MRGSKVMITGVNCWNDDPDDMTWIKDAVYKEVEALCFTVMNFLKQMLLTAVGRRRKSKHTSG